MTAVDGIENLTGPQSKLTGNGSSTLSTCRALTSGASSYASSPRDSTVTFGSGSSSTIQYSGIPAFAYSPAFWTRSVRSLPLREHHLGHQQQVGCVVGRWDRKAL